MKSFNKSLSNSINLIVWLMQTFQILLMYYETMEENIYLWNQGYKSAIIFLLPELIKQGLLQGQISNFIAWDIVEDNNIVNLTKQ